MNVALSSLINNDETEYLEFKREWYWKNNEKPTLRMWGEFLKDFVALVNCSPDYVGQYKYLIIGVNESETDVDKRLVNVNLAEMGFTSLVDLKSQIVKKLSDNFRINKKQEGTFVDFEVSIEEIKGKFILAFSIKPASGIVVLDKDLQDKNRTEKRNNVFIRSLKNSGDPEVINASPEDIDFLREKLKNYKKTRNKELNREKSVEKTVKVFIDSNKMYSLVNSHKKKSWKDGILYEVYSVESDFSKINFIYLFDKSNQIKTYEHLVKEEILKKGSSNIVLIDNGLKKDINGIKAKFNATGVYSLDGFALEYLYKKHLDEDVYHDGSFKKQRKIKNFIDPFSADKKEKTALTKLSEWFDKESMPLMVIKGYGGVGKTTLVKYFLDDLYTSYLNSRSKSKILFIDSKKIIDEISKGGNIDNIFFFYQAYAKSKDLSYQFDKELLELSIDNGNLLLVLDGIDEVIAKLGNKFKVNSFIESIYNNYLLGNEKTKIIFTCRDYFWDLESVDGHAISTLEIHPFNNVLAKKFFLKQFENNSKELAQCLKYSDEFKMSETSDQGVTKDLYIPYILDVIMDMVRQKKGLGEVSKDDISSNLLNTEIVNDYFIGRICNREIEKLKNLGIDDQLKFFINMAVNFNGVAHKSNRSKLFRGVGVKDTNEIFTLFKGHTLVDYDKDSHNISFKYDFFRDYFINLYVSEFFINRKMTEVNQTLIEILNEHVRYGNSFTSYLCQRVSYDDDLKLFIIEIVETVANKLKKREKISDRKLISSMLVILLVGLKYSGQKYDTPSRTKLLVDLFGVNFDYLSIVNLLDCKEANPIFDFRDVKIDNAWFENYSRFWECKINDNTYFYNSTFNHLTPRDGVSLPKIHKDLFLDCDISGIMEILNKNDGRKSAKTETVKNEVLKIFGFFNTNGTFKEQKIDLIKHKSDPAVLNVLLKNKVIMPYKNPKKPKMKQYRVTDKYFDIIALSDQRGNSFELQSILKFF